MSEGPKGKAGALSGYSLVTICQALATFASVGIFTRLLDPAAYGRYALAMASALMLQAVLFSWLHTGMVRFFHASDATVVPVHLRTSWAAFAACSALVVGLAAVAEPWVGGLAPAAAAFLITRSGLMLALEQHRMAGHVRRYMFLEIGQAVLGLGAGAVLVLLLPPCSEAPLFGLAIGNAAALLLDLRHIRAAMSGRVSLPHLRALLRYGLPMGVAILMATVTQLFDRFLLAAFLDEAAAGVYAVAYAAADRPIAMVFTWLGMSCAPAVLAAYEKHGREAAEAEVGQMARMILLIGLPAVVGLTLIAEPLAAVLVGPEYRGVVVTLMPWIAVAALLNGITAHYLAVPFILQRRSGVLAGSMAGCAALNTGLNLILIPRLGLWGAVFATILAYAAIIALRYTLVRGWMRMAFPFGDAVRCTAAAAAMGLGLSSLPLPNGAAGLLPTLLAGAAIYTVAAWTLDAAGARRYSLALWRRRSRSAAR